MRNKNFSHASACPCKGRPQKVRKQLTARMNEFSTDGSAKLSGFRKPGSQNANK